MPKYSFEQFAAVRNYADFSFSPDGEWVTFSTNASGQFNVWKQRVGRGPDGPYMPIQLTTLVNETARRAVWSPDGTRILTTADHHGNENFQLLEIPAEEGWLYPITDNPDARHEISGQPFSPDGTLLAYGTNERNPSDFDVVVRELASGEVRPILAGDANYFPAAWSPDGTHLTVVKFNSNTDQDIYVCDIAAGTQQHITPHEGDVKFFPASWEADSSGFYFVTDQGREFMALNFYDMATGEIRVVEAPDWDIQGGDGSKDGRYRAWLVNEDGYSRLYVRDRQTDTVRTFDDLPKGVYTSLSFNPTRPILGMLITRSVRPGELTMLDVESGEHWTLTQGYLGGVPIADMVEPELIRYPTHDGREIPAFLYKPHGMKAGEKAPVVLSVHGGPEAQELPTYNYNGLYQYLLNRGIGIIATNIRGSTGYGKSYQTLIHRDWGGDELKDLEHAVFYLQGLDWVNSEKLGVFGGSFGGFATLSCVTRLPQYWAAAVDIVGPSNLITFVKAVPPFWRRFMAKWVGDPEEDKEFLIERSPITYVDDIQAPILIIQGANDPRVVKPESDQMVARLEELGRTVEYMVFEDEGHGFTKTANTLKALGASAKWFEKYLL